MLEATTADKLPKNEMSMMTWMATEGGRKCPMCGKYAKAKDLGWVGFHATDHNGNGMIVDAYGHLHGCGKKKKKTKKILKKRR